MSYGLCERQDNQFTRLLLMHRKVSENESVSESVSELTKKCNMNEIIIILVVMFVPLGIGILLLTGKISAADAISGYNTMSKKKKEKYDEKALSRYFGWLLLIFCLGFIFLIITKQYIKSDLLKYCFIALVVLQLVGCFYARTSKRFRKDKCTNNQHTKSGFEQWRV